MSIRDVYRAINLVEKYHKGQKYSIHPYVYHLQAVSDSIDTGDNFTHIIVAWLHDILEDTTCTEAELREQFSKEIVDAVVAISKVPGEKYFDYIEKVKQNPIALSVKIHDTLCNLTESIKAKERSRIRKYAIQLTILVD